MACTYVSGAERDVCRCAPLPPHTQALHTNTGPRSYEKAIFVAASHAVIMRVIHYAVCLPSYQLHKHNSTQGVQNKRAIHIVIFQLEILQ